MTPLISVVVPIYNTETYLEACLASILDQTFSLFEVICVVDCSPDNSVGIVKNFQKIDSRVKLVEHDVNLGQGGARNTGIRLAKADYIASVDSDDTIHNNMLEVLWKAVNNGEFDVVCCGFSRVMPNGKVISKHDFPNKKMDVFEKSHEGGSVNIFTVMNPAFWNKLWKKSLFVDNNILFPHKLYYQDMATIPLLVAKSKKIRFIDNNLYNYLVRESSVTTTFSEKHIIDYFKIYSILFFHLNRFGISHIYSDQLFKYVHEGMRFHSSNVVKSDTMNQEEKNQYLKYLLMLKVSFLDSFEHLVDKSESELLVLLRTASSVRDIVPFVSEESALIKERRLNNLQLLGCKIFGRLFYFILRPSYRVKLELEPQAFFEDSKNKLTRFIGYSLRIIKN